MPIDIEKLTESDKQREVRYESHGTVEWGRITSWNEQFIFVCYHSRLWRGQRQPRTGTTSEATAPADLEFCD